MNEDRPFYEATGARKKTKGDLKNDGPCKLAGHSLVWEKMVGQRHRKILE